MSPRTPRGWWVDYASGETGAPRLTFPLNSSGAAPTAKWDQILDNLSRFLKDRMQPITQTPSEMPIQDGAVECESPLKEIVCGILSPLPDKIIVISWSPIGPMRRDSDIELLAVPHHLTRRACGRARSGLVFGAL